MIPYTVILEKGTGEKKAMFLIVVIIPECKGSGWVGANLVILMTL